jgi:hypothetical protein
MKKFSGVFIFLFILILVAVISLNVSIPIRTLEYPEGARGSNISEYERNPYTRGDMRIEFDDLVLTIEYLKTSKKITVDNIANVAINNNSATWITQTYYLNGQITDKYWGSDKTVFDVHYYNFEKDEEKILIKDFDNGLNPNNPAIAMSDRHIAITSRADNLTIIDIETGEVDKISTIDYVDVVSDDSLTIINDSIIFTGYIGMPPKNQWYIYSYDIDNNDFDRLRKSPSRRNITDMKFLSNKVYWIEMNSHSWAKRKYFRFLGRF